VDSGEQRCRVWGYDQTAYPFSLLTSQAQPAKKGGQPSMWVRALRLAAGVGRYKTRGDDASPAGPAGGRDLSAHLQL
jgi:hypothetical protein